MNKIAFVLTVLGLEAIHGQVNFPSNDPRCPRKEPTRPLKPRKCKDEGLSCNYGQESCCGEVRPSMRYICDGGDWSAMVTEACMNPLCQNQINITENGAAVVQESSYDVRNHEAVLRVPAHSNYGDNSFVMIGRDADSELAGKMMSIEGDSCELHDIPDFVNVEDLESNIAQDDGNVQIVRRYVTRSNLIEIPQGSEEYNSLSNEMKRECEGKQIFRSDIIVSEEEEDNGFQENGFFIPIPENNSGAEASFAVARMLPVTTTTTSRPVTPGPCPNEQVLAACQDTSPLRSCYYWNVNNNPNVRFHVLSRRQLPANELCIKCCQVEGTPIIPCNCVTDRQTFSTAHFQLHFSCFAATGFPNFNFGSTALNNKCNWSGFGACEA